MANEKDRGVQIKTGQYPCNVRNCGGGDCVHQWFPAVCPICKSHQLVLTTNTQFVWCSDPRYMLNGCEYIATLSDYKKQHDPRGHTDKNHDG